MSTPLPTEADDPGAPIAAGQAGLDELVGWFAAAEKPRAAFRVGTEHEKFGFLRDGLTRHKPLPFDGENGIEAILEAIAAEGGWVRAQDASTGRPRTIALFGRGTYGDASITLEPGGQVELSGAPVRTIHETCAEVGEHLQLLRRICLPRGVGFIGMGFHPTARSDDMPLVPKSRYAVMQRYMPTVGSRGIDMMKRTATVQANYDWLDERDMVQSYQTALLVSPLVAALFANSPFVEGKPTGAVSERQRVWADTDRNRAGFPPVILAKDFSYARYVEWALDVPMYFVRRGGVHHDVAGASFRTFMGEGLLIDGEKVRATIRDFSDHMTTVFPEVRMKRVLEVRSADCGPWSRICALPALYKGILYDLTARDEARALMDGATSEELSALRADIAERGYRAVWRGKPVLGPCAELVAIAQRGLARIGELDDEGRDESRFLKTLVDSVDKGETFAERLLRLYETRWDKDLSRLWDEVEFFHEHETSELVRMRTRP